MKSAKGSKYERELCTRFSLWWSHGSREDIFWRSAGSGARAKTRGRAGKATSGQHGDLAAIDPVGTPLIAALTIEIKRGYSKFTPYDMLDASPNAAQQEWAKFVEQAKESAAQAGSISWAIIHKRDRRDEIICLPSAFIEAIVDTGSKLLFAETETGQRNMELTLKINGVNESLVFFHLNDFFECVYPAQIRKIVNGTRFQRRTSGTK